MHTSEIKNNTLDVVRSAVLKMLRMAEVDEDYTNPWQKVKFSVQSTVARRIRPLLLVVRPTACERVASPVWARLPIKSA